MKKCSSSRSTAATPFRNFAASKRTVPRAATPGQTPAARRFPSLTIYFQRPNPDAKFYSLNTGGSPTGEVYASAFVKVVGPQDIVTRQVVVTLPGADIGKHQHPRLMMIFSPLHKKKRIHAH